MQEDLSTRRAGKLKEHHKNGESCSQSHFFKSKNLDASNWKSRHKVVEAWQAKDQPGSQGNILCKLTKSSLQSLCRRFAALRSAKRKQSVRQLTRRNAGMRSSPKLLKSKCYFMTIAEKRDFYF